MNTPTKQFILSALVGLIASISYLGSSFILDKYVSYNTSNIIGLTIDHFVNFVLQQLIFIGHLKNIKKYIIKFFVANTIVISYSQILFILAHKYTRVHYPDFYKNKWDKHISIIRYLLGMLVYPLSFSLRKYYVFT